MAPLSTGPGALAGAVGVHLPGVPAARGDAVAVRAVGDVRMSDEQRIATEYAALAAYWRGRLDVFCDDLEEKGFRVERDGLTVRIFTPEPEMRNIAPSTGS